VELEECDHGPSGCDNCDDEEDEDGYRWGSVTVGVFIDEISEHSPYWYEGDYLEESEEEEDCCTDHLDGCEW